MICLPLIASWCSRFLCGCCCGSSPPQVSSPPNSQGGKRDDQNVFVQLTQPQGAVGWAVAAAVLLLAVLLTYMSLSLFNGLGAFFSGIVSWVSMADAGVDEKIMQEIRSNLPRASDMDDISKAKFLAADNFMSLTHSHGSTAAKHSDPMKLSRGIISQLALSGVNFGQSEEVVKERLGDILALCDEFLETDLTVAATTTDVQSLHLACGKNPNSEVIHAVVAFARITCETTRRVMGAYANEIAGAIRAIDLVKEPLKRKAHKELLNKIKRAHGHDALTEEDHEEPEPGGTEEDDVVEPEGTEEDLEDEKNGAVELREETWWIPSLWNREPTFDEEEDLPSVTEEETEPQPVDDKSFLGKMFGKVKTMTNVVKMFGEKVKEGFNYGHARGGEDFPEAPPGLTDDSEFKEDEDKI